MNEVQLNQVIFKVRPSQKADIDLDLISNSLHGFSKYKGSVTFSNSQYCYRITKNGFFDIYLKRFRIFHNIHKIKSIANSIKQLANQFAIKSITNLSIHLSNFQYTFSLSTNKTFFQLSEILIDKLSQNYSVEIRESRSSETLWFEVSTLKANSRFSSIRFKNKESNTIFVIESTLKGNFVSKDILEFQSINNLLSSQC